MELSAALIADLADLTLELDRPRVDLEASLRAFADNARVAVDSYLGLSITLFAAGLPFTVTALEASDAGARSTSSLRIPLPSLHPGDDRGTMILYASTPGAFVDLAADLAAALEIPMTTFAPDADLPPPDPQGDTGLDAVATVNQAIGVLIARGHTPDNARVELRARAARAGATVLDAAHEVLGTLGAPRTRTNG